MPLATMPGPGMRRDACSIHRRVFSPPPTTHRLAFSPPSTCSFPSPMTLHRGDQLCMARVLSSAVNVSRLRPASRGYRRVAVMLSRRAVSAAVTYLRGAAAACPA